MVPEAYSEQSGTSKMEFFVLIVNGWNSGRLFFSKSFILDVLLHSKYASGTVNYCRQKLHLKSLIGPWICLCLYWVWQFLNETSKVCYQETNGNKHVPLFLGIPVRKFLYIFILDGRLSTRRPVAWLQSLWTLISCISLGSRK